MKVTLKDAISVIALFLLLGALLYASDIKRWLFRIGLHYYHADGFQNAESIAAMAPPTASPSSAVNKDQMIQTVREMARLLPLVEQARDRNIATFKELTNQGTADKVEGDIAALAKYKDGASEQAALLQQLQGFDSMPADTKTKLQTQLYLDYSKVQTLYTMFVVTLQTDALNPSKPNPNMTAQALASLAKNLENLRNAEQTSVVLNPPAAAAAPPAPAPPPPLPPPPAPPVQPPPPSPIPPPAMAPTPGMAPPPAMPVPTGMPPSPAPPPPPVEGFQSGGNPYNAPSPNLQQAFEFRLGKRQFVDAVMQNANSR